MLSMTTGRSSLASPRAQVTFGIKKSLLPALLLSTGIASGMAIPARRDELSSTDTFSLGPSPTPVNWDALNASKADGDIGDTLETRDDSRKSASDLLKCPPFAPTDVTLFTPQVYSNAPVTVPAPPKTITDDQLLNTLADMWSRAGHGNKDKALRELKPIFNHPEFKKVVPDARLRAAILSLRDTSAESAIRDIANKRIFSQVSFKQMPEGVISARVPHGKDNKPEIYVNSRYQYEDFRVIAGELAHEGQHQDDIDSGREERINQALATIVYAEQLERKPELAHSGTELVRRENTKLMARLNSRDAKGDLRLFTSKGNVYPGGKPLDNFGAAFTTIGSDTQSGNTISDSSPGNSALGEWAKKVTGVSVRQPDFDQAMEAVIDQNQKALSKDDVVAVAKNALKLKTDC